MKKVLHTVLIFALFLPLVIMPQEVGAKTLRDLVNELNRLEQEHKDTKREQQLTEQEIRNTHSNIDRISRNIQSIQDDITITNEEIVKLDEEIKEKDAEIKEIMNFLQLSSGESAYLEYAFGAKDFTDFIYRVAISEQLANHNNSLIDEFNNLIIQNNEKIESLRTRTVELRDRQSDLRVEIERLGDKLDEITDVAVDIEQELKLQKEAVELYQRMGCRLDEPIATCGNRLPRSTSFLRPVTNAVVTSEFGWRVHPTLGTSRMHFGVDLATGRIPNVPVYAASEGMVVGIIHRYWCGGNIVYVDHNVNGQNYSTMYAHLRTINVQRDQIVTKDTVIGIMGGSPADTPWDQCSTGQHLHFQVANGLYAEGNYNARSFNPRNVINLPSRGVWFGDRWTRY